MFSLVRLDFSQPIVSMCYVGLAAPFMAGVLHILGLDVPVYHVRITFLNHINPKPANIILS